MSEPIVYVGTYKILEGRLDAFKEAATEIAAFVEANEPQLLAYTEYINESGTEATGIQIHPNSESMETHMEVAGHVFAKAMEFITDVTINIYGTPIPSLEEQLKERAKLFGVSMTVHKTHAGFSRLPTAGEPTHR